MYLKIMSSEDLPDIHSAKEYELIDVLHCRFERAPNIARVHYTCDGLQWNERELTGNAYILNEQGKTIETFSRYSYIRGAVKLPTPVAAVAAH